MSVTKVEYKIVDSFRQQDVVDIMNRAAAEGWRYVDRIYVNKYGQALSILMAREVTV